MLDHIGKPAIKTGGHAAWAADIALLGQNKNVWCKLSGMVTEADWQNWKPTDFNPYLDVIVNTFGADRIMFGSDWPVCKIAADYGQVLGIAETYFSAFTKTEQANIFGGNAARFYNL